MIRRPPRSTQSRSSAASDVYKRQTQEAGHEFMNIKFKDDHSAHLTFPETYNPEKDEAAVQRVMDALKINGYDNITAAY